MNREYERYLQSEAWQEKRIQRLAIAQNRCAACSNSRAVHVHHLTYARIFNEDMADLLPLCDLHHVAAEELIKQGKLNRFGDVLFLAVETVRLILTVQPAKKSPHKLGNWKRDEWKTIPLGKFSMTARNTTQETLLTNAEFVSWMLSTNDRKVFKYLLGSLIATLPETSRRGQYMNNGCCLFDRSKRKRHRL
jgi:hypothetical protein